MKKYILVDDLDGTDADRSIDFSFDGANYSIDLNEKNLEAFQKAIAMYVESATKHPRTGLSLVPSKPGIARNRPNYRQKTDPEQNRAIRAWAVRRGMAVSAKGAISNAVLDAYHANA